MNVAVTGTGTHTSLPESKIDPSPPKKANAASFQTINAAEVHSITYERECHGVANELDMDAFFAAWGSDDASYDVDGNGIVDGGDLTILLSGQSGNPTPGTADDVLQQWGATGDSSADLNGDGLVDGEDLVLALAGPPAPPPPPQQEAEASYESKLEGLLADWGTDAERSDLNNGIVDGSISPRCSPDTGTTTARNKPLDAEPWIFPSPMVHRPDHRPASSLQMPSPWPTPRSLVEGSSPSSRRWDSTPTPRAT